MSPHDAPPTQGLLQFSIDVLEQALTLVAAHELRAAPPYASPVGMHLRHVIEHYDALLFPLEPGSVDYDRRPRDRELETQPAVARARLQALKTRLLEGPQAQLASPLQVRGLGGLAGDFEFAVDSSLGRELAFVASHAIHHFALLLGHCKQQGIPLGAQFGRAPATVAHERSAPPVPPHLSLKETPCKT